MCTIDRLQIKIKQKANKVDSNHNRDLPPAFLDDYIYEAMFDYVELFWSGKNYKGFNLGFETNIQRIDFLSFLLRSISFTPSSFSNNIAIYDLPEDYYHFVRLDNSTDCGSSVFEIVQHEDLSYILDDEYRKPSKKWNRYVVTLKNNKLYVYTGEGQTINEIQLEYLKKPRKPFSGNYNTLEFNGGDTSYPSSTSDKINPEFPEQYCDILADITVQNLFGNLRDYNYSQFNQTKIINKTF